MADPTEASSGASAAPDERVHRFRHRWRHLFVALLTGALAVWTLLEEGVSGSFLIYAGAFAFSVVYAVRGLSAAEERERWNALSARRRRGMLIASLALAAGLMGIDYVTVRGAPLLAGPELREVRAAASPVVGRFAAAPGHRWVVLDAEVGSRLGAPLRAVSYIGFALETPTGTIESDGLATRNLPDACDRLEVARWSSRRCTVAFEVPDDVATARLVYDGWTLTARSSRLELSALPPAELARIDLAARVETRAALPSDPSRVALLVRVSAEPRGGAPAVELDGLRLTAPDGGWRSWDRSGDLGLSSACGVTLLAEAATCTALFEVPRDADRARLTIEKGPIDPDEPAEARVAGAVDLDF